jgi:hypothetical protein
MKEYYEQLEVEPVTMVPDGKDVRTTKNDVPTNPD